MFGAHTALKTIVNRVEQRTGEFPKLSIGKACYAYSHANYMNEGKYPFPKSTG